MARSDLRCTSCGYHFSVGGAQLSKPEGVRCPSCLAPVGTSGPIEGGPGPKPVRVLEAAPNTGALQMKIWIGVGAAGVLVLGVVAAVFLMGESTPPPASNEPSTRKRPAPAPAPIVKPKPAQRPVEKPTTAAKPAEAPSPGTVEPAPAPVTAALSPQAVDPPLPDDLLRPLREEVLALKEWHLSLVMSAPEKRRMDDLLAAGKGGAEDVTFLRGVLDPPRLRAVKEEAMMIREALARLEKEALEGLPVDKVTMTDGRTLHGIIREETTTVVKLERKFASGLAGELPLKRTDIKDVLKGKGIGGEFKTRWEGAKKSGPAALVGLLAWCKENALPLQASLAAHAILVDEPGRAEARQEAGLAADPVSRMLEADKQGGFITYEGRRWLPRELKDKLLRDGYAIVDGKWMSGKPRLIGVPGLFRYETQNEKPVQISGNVAHEEVTTYNVVQGQDKVEVKPVRRFYAGALMTVASTRKAVDSKDDADQILVEDKATPAQGTSMRGEVFITVPVNAPILEASVMTSAEVKSGGAITVYLIVNGQRHKLYQCDAKENTTHKLPPDLIRGKTEVQLVAEITGTASYGKKKETLRVKRGKKDTGKVIERGLDVTFHQLIPEYSAMLFPSNANTVEVFRLTATTAEPAPGLDKLFQNAPEILKQ